MTSFNGADPDGIQRLMDALAGWEVSSSVAACSRMTDLAAKSLSAYEGVAFELALITGYLKHGVPARLVEDGLGADIEAVIDGRPLQVECKVLQPRDVNELFAQFMDDTFSLCVQKLNRRGRTEVRCLGYVADAVESAPLSLEVLWSLVDSPRPLEQSWPGLSLKFEPGLAPHNSPFVDGAKINNNADLGDHFELIKLRQTVRRHVKQLRPEHPGIFAVLCRDLFDTSTAPEEISTHVADGIRDLPQISGILCLQEDAILQTEAPWCQNEDFLWTIAPSPARFRRVAFFRRNPNARFPVSVEGVKVLMKSYILG